MNQVMLTGRLTRDPDIRYTPSGVAVCRFTIAVPRQFKTSDGKDADFINCTAWRNSAEFMAEYLKKGDPVILSGRIQQRTWQAQDGTNRNEFSIVCDRVEAYRYRGNGKTKKSDEYNSDEEAYEDQDPFVGDA